MEKEITEYDFSTLYENGVFFFVPSRKDWYNMKSELELSNSVVFINQEDVFDRIVFRKV